MGDRDGDDMAGEARLTAGRDCGEGGKEGREGIDAVRRERWRIRDRGVSGVGEQGIIRAGDFSGDTSY